MRLKIDYLNNFGNGVARSSKKILVPYTLEGEEIEAQMVLEKKNYGLAGIKKILKPSLERVQAPCLYYTECGGCNLQHLSSARYQQFKQEQLDEIIQKTGSPQAESELYIFPAGIRQRANFKVKNKKVGFYKQASHEIVFTEKCIALNSDLNEAIKLINQMLASITREIFEEVTIVNAENGIDVLFILKDQLTLNEKNIIKNMAALSALIRISYKIGSNIEIIYSSSEPYILLANLRIELPVDCFLQASKESINLIAGIVSLLADSYPVIIDLFAGIGTYGYFLSKKSQVTGFESSQTMVNAINFNAKKYKLNLKGIMRDLHKKPLKASELSPFNLAIINPPRSGASTQVKIFSGCDIIMVSCNPVSFIADAKMLIKKGYQMKKIYAVDQFHWTNHLELVAFFQKP